MSMTMYTYARKHFLRMFHYKSILQLQIFYLLFQKERYDHGGKGINAEFNIFGGQVRSFCLTYQNIVKKKFFLINIFTIRVKCKKFLDESY